MRPVTRIKILGIRLGVIALTVYWITIFIGTHLPDVPDVVSLVNDKVKHFAAFFGLTTLLCYVSSRQKREKNTLWRGAAKRFGAVAAVALAYAAIDEWSQRFVAGRHPDILDFLADAAGIASAIAVYLAMRRSLPNDGQDTSPDDTSADG